MDDDTASNTISEASIPRQQAIHSDTLSSSYLIPIRTVSTDEGYDSVRIREEEEIYDNLVGRNDNSLIKF